MLLSMLSCVVRLKLEKRGGESRNSWILMSRVGAATHGEEFLYVDPSDGIDESTENEDDTRQQKVVRIDTMW